MDNDEKILACLERIAYNTDRNTPLECKDYLEKVVYASSIKGTEDILRDLRTRSPAREGEVSKHDTKPVSRLHGNSGKRVAIQEEQLKKDDSRRSIDGSETKR